MSCIGKTILVAPMSAKGKQRVKDWGNTWRIIDVGHRGLFIQSIKDTTGLSKRWLDEPEDSDLKIILEQE